MKNLKKWDINMLTIKKIIVPLSNLSDVNTIHY